MLTPASKLAGDPEMLTPASKLAGGPEMLTPASKLAGDPEMLTPASKLAGDPEMWGTRLGLTIQRDGEADVLALAGGQDARGVPAERAGCEIISKQNQNRETPVISG